MTDLLVITFQHDVFTTVCLIICYRTTHVYGSNMFTEVLSQAAASKRILLLLVTLMIVGVFLFMCSYKNEQPHAQKLPHILPFQGYVFALDYYDQHTNGLYRLLSLQCWAGSMNMLVVEPFLLKTTFGVGDAMLENQNSRLHYASVIFMTLTTGIGMFKKLILLLENMLLLFLGRNFCRKHLIN